MRVSLSSCRRDNISLLKTIAEAKDLNLGKAIHAHLIRSSQSDIIQTNHLINIYARCGQSRSARRVFDAMPERNVVSGNALMAGYLHDGFPSEVLAVFKAMVCGESMERPNEYVFATVLAACSQIRAFTEGRQCHASVVKSGFMHHSYVRNSLIQMYLRCSAMQDALSVFRNVESFDAFPFNSMINGFLDHGRLSEAVDVLNSIVKEVACWDNVTYIVLLGLCTDLKDLRLGGQLHNQILKRGVEACASVGSAIVDMYGKCGDVSSARHAFNWLPCKNVVSWTAIMVTCVQNGFFEESLILLLQMGVHGVRPNEFTYAVALNSCAGLSSLRNGDVLNAHAEKSGCKGNLVVGNALINMYSKCGSIEDAERVFTRMHHRDIITWNSIITGYSHHGLGREALQAFHYLTKEKDLVPNYVTFVGVLSACGHLGLMSEAFYYLNYSMRSLGIEPGLEHHTCMVGLLCRAGRLDEADNYMRNTFVEWDIVAWRTLVSACQVHKNVGLGRKVAEHILQLDPEDVGTYILLSNMFAKANRWDGVVRIRKLMRGRDLKKEPGVSWIQVQNETHVFTSDDKSHPWMNQIYAKVEQLIAELKLIGYVPDIGIVLHDVEDEQKEEYLSYHSEKLAIAFGLITLPLGAHIHVMKNLRMCDDCHTAVKLISNVTSRKIVVRDANRFHSFENGLCTCDDYW